MTAYVFEVHYEICILTINSLNFLRSSFLIALPIILFVCKHNDTV